MYTMQSKTVESLLAKYEEYIKRTNEEESHAQKIHVDEIASKVAAFYEKVRNVIDYREEHLLRKNTIERALRRRIFLKDLGKKFAEPLIKELIRSGHLPNDSVPESKIPEIQKIIDNLIYLLERGTFASEQEKETVSNWLIAISGSAIEEELFPPAKDRILAEVMFDTMRENLEVRGAELDEQEMNVQLFIGVQRALFRPDDTQLQYRLLKFAYPNWGKLSEKDLVEIAPNLAALKHSLGSFLKHPLKNYFLRLCNKEKIVFLLLGDLVFGGRSSFAEASQGRPFGENLENELKMVYDRRYKKAQAQLHRLALLSVISFFISKILVAVAVEIPLDHYLAHSFSLINTGINVVFPPFLMLVIVAFIRLPSKENLFLITNEVKKLVFSEEPKKYAIVVPKKRGWITEILVRLAYFVTLVIVLFYLVQFLLLLKFSPASIVIFALFTSMVIATGVRVNNRAKEMSLEKEKPSFWSFILDLIIVPFMAIGKWTIAGLSKFNIIVIAFNFLIELPLQLFVEFLENFRGFIKSKKEETN